MPYRLPLNPAAIQEANKFSMDSLYLPEVLSGQSLATLLHQEG